MCQKMEQSQRKNMNPNYLIELINRAAKKAGSDAALARELEVSRSRIGDWRHGRTTCPPADVALMAAVAGLDAEAWAARAVISQHEGTAKGVKLEAALKKAFVATGAALVSFGATAAENVAYFIRCIDCQQEDRRMTFVF
jgi:hypothetical protein